MTISGGNRNFVIIKALSVPPNTPTTKVKTIASGSGKCASRHNAPITTAESPIIEPTDKSIPPVIIIGVITSASKPISTAKRVISNAFPAVRKLFPITLNKTISTSKTTSKTHSLFGKTRAKKGCSVRKLGCRIVSCIVFLAAENHGKDTKLRILLTADERG